MSETTTADPTRKPYCYEYPRPAVTVDLVAFARFGTDLRVLLIRRAREPFTGRWALPGGFLDIDEPIEAAARRELREETGLDVSGPIAFIGVFGDPGRDPRGRTISLAHAAVVPDSSHSIAGADDAAEAAWRDLRDARGLAFDHDAILAAALEWLRQGVAQRDRGLALLPAEFDVVEVETMLRALGLPGLPATLWLERLLNAGAVTATGPGPGSDRFRAVTR
jgi:8-oxo-dGTP diphosphatase